MVAGSSLLGGCGWLTGRGPEPEAPPWAGAVDIHAHVFNAADLPARGFFQQAVLGVSQQDIAEGTERNLLDELVILAGVLGDAARLVAPTAQAELAGLADCRSLAEARAKAMTISPGDAALEQMVARVLHRIFRVEDRNAPGFEAIDLQIDPADVRRTRRIIRTVSAVAYRNPVSGPPARKRQRLSRLAHLLLNERGKLKVAGPWARGIVRSRMQIMEEIAAKYGGPGEVGLFVPLQIDYAAWLDDPMREGSRIPDQIAAAQRLQDIWNAEAEGPLFHGFLAYDPARDALDGGATLDRAREAIESRGFLGLKMYPVMGFAALGNTDDPDSYPPSIRRAFRLRFGSDGTIGTELDRALLGLYAWADREGVPILAHANSSYSADGQTAYRARAHPARWVPVFERFWNLRVCLAHFGDFNIAGNDECRADWQFDRQGFRLAGRDRRSQKCGDAAWELTTMELLTRFRGRAFADLSYHDLAFRNGVNTPAWRLAGGARARFEEGWARLRAGNGAAQGLMFGTDWLLTGQETHHADNIEDLDVFLRDFGFDAPAVRRAVFRETALKFLGLRPDAAGPGGASYRRLRAYYEAHERLDPARLDRFLGVAV